ncbi:hypothetical protein [Streptomyces oceani]|uniref:Uncharacterized protein n=1 Tax=Streptomyces oceani TaxID=1075402 RepID=A0A1E7KN07_9ACTN|nr:hypothetical protein [Streptomyces oceani]OEV05211.1 hypothetical protein AN216_04075 [Streptomyces oceani]
MSSTSSPSQAPSTSTPSRLALEEANAAIREFVAGRHAWTPADLEELARLRRVWMEAARLPVEEAA